MEVQNISDVSSKPPRGKSYLSFLLNMIFEAEARKYEHCIFLYNTPIPTDILGFADPRMHFEINDNSNNFGARSHAALDAAA